MKPVSSAQFMKSATAPDQYPRHDLPEIAFIGRSNVGKSSLINTLVKKKNLARTSNTPGRTQLINFFNVQDRVCFVDLPGYGFAQVPAHVKQHWKPMIEAYLTTSQHLCRVVLILDARHTPTRQDVMMREWLDSCGIPALYVATKIDKLPKSKISKHLAVIRDTLHLSTDDAVFQFSALTKTGVQTIWKAIWQATVPTS